MRALAVLAVMLYHAAPALLPGGYLGVDVFFVISGFLITGLLVAEYERRARISVLQFFARRIRRLLPMSFLATVTTLAAAAAVYGPVRVPVLARDAMWVALYVGNYRFAAEQVDYLANPDPSPFQHFWSLAVEEQYYLSAPLLVLVAIVVARRFGRKTADIRWPLAGLSLAVVVGSTTVSWQATQTSQSYAFFGLPSRAWELAAGGLLAIVLPRLPAASRLAAGVAGWSGAVLLGGSLVLLDEERAFPGLWPGFPVAGTLLLLWAGSSAQPRGLRAVLENPVSVSVGTVSYSLYLWHWPLLVLVPAWLGSRSSVVVLGCLAATVVLSYASFALVENPLRESRALRATPRLTYALLGTLTAVSLAACVGAPHVWRVPRTGVQVGTVTAIVPPLAPPTVVPRTTRPGLLDARTDISAASTCQVGYRTRTPRICTRGDPDGDRSIVLFGDSHASHWFPALDAYARSRGYQLHLVLKSSCPAVRGYRFRSYALEREFVECRDWVELALDRITRLAPEIVVVANTTLGYTEPLTGDYPRSWRTGLGATFAQLPTTATKVLLLDTPRFPQPPAECLARNATDPARCGVAVDSAIHSTGRRAERQAAQDHDVHVVDPVPWLCTTVCHGLTGDLVLYADTNHLTATAAGALSELLARELDQAVTGKR